MFPDIDLFDRIFGDPDETEQFKISVLLFWAACVDYAAGATTRTQLINGLALGDSAVTQLDLFLGKIDALKLANGIESAYIFLEDFKAVALLTEQGLKYTTKASFNARINVGLANFS